MRSTIIMLSVTAAFGSACASVPVVAAGPVAAEVLQEEFLWACTVPQQEYPQATIAWSACPKEAKEVRCVARGSGHVACDYLLQDGMKHTLRYSGRSYQRVGEVWRLDPSTGRSALHLPIPKIETLELRKRR
jgi:hypothetical protein